MLRQHLQASRTASQQILTPAPTPTSSALLRALARSSLPYSTSGSRIPPKQEKRDDRWKGDNPWKEWAKPNKRLQARQEIYGSIWPETVSREDAVLGKSLHKRRERAKEKLWLRLGDKYDAYVEERKKEVYEEYASAAWREEIEEIKKYILREDARRRKDGILTIELPRTVSPGDKTQGTESRGTESLGTESQGTESQSTDSQRTTLQSTEQQSTEQKSTEQKSTESQTDYGIAAYGTTEHKVESGVA